MVAGSAGPGEEEGLEAQLAEGGWYSHSHLSWVAVWTLDCQEFWGVTFPLVAV
jgi:hypothetical protein